MFERFLLALVIFGSSTVFAGQAAKVDFSAGVRSTEPLVPDEERKGALRISFKISDRGEVIDSRVFEPSNEIAKQIAPCVERAV